MILLKHAVNAVIYLIALLTMLPLGCLWGLFALCGEIAKPLDRLGYRMETVARRLMLK